MAIILREITGTVRKPNGDVWANAQIVFELISSIVADADAEAVYPRRKQAIDCDENGLIPTSGNVPTVIAGYTYKLHLPDGAYGNFVAPTDSAAALSIDEVIALIAGGAAEETEGYTGIPLAQADLLLDLYDAAQDADAGEVAEADGAGKVVFNGRVGLPTADAAWVATGKAGGALGTAAYAATGDFDAAGTGLPRTGVSIGATEQIQQFSQGVNVGGAMLFNLSTLPTADPFSPGTVWRDGADIKVSLAEYILNEDFITSESAPIASPRACEPGPGNLIFIDTGNKASITGGKYVTSGATASNDPSFIAATAAARADGLCLVANGGVQNRSILGFYKDETPPGNKEHAFYNNFGTWLVYVGNSTRAVSAPSEAPSGFAIVCKATGAYYYWRVAGTWELAWEDSSQNSASLYAKFSDVSAAITGIDKFAVASLPTGLTASERIAYIETIYATEPDTITNESVTAAFDAAMTGSAVGIYRAGNNYYIWQDLGNSRYAHYQLQTDGTIHELGTVAIKNGKLPASTVLQAIHSTNSVFEYVFDVSGVGWVGNQHGHDTQSALTITVDGSAETLADGDAAEGATSVIVTRTSVFDNGSGNVANVSTVYTLTPGEGLDVAVSVEFTDTVIVTGGYSGMMPFDEVLDTGSWAGAKAAYTLSNNDGSTYIAPSTRAIYAYDAGGNYAAAIISSVNKSTSLQDRFGGALNKIYLNATAETYAASDTLQINNTYKVAHFDDLSPLIR